MKRLTLSLSEETVLKDLLEVQIETYVDVYGSKQRIQEEEMLEELKVMVSLYIQLGGSFETHLKKESLVWTDMEG